MSVTVSQSQDANIIEWIYTFLKGGALLEVDVATCRYLQDTVADLRAIRRGTLIALSQLIPSIQGEELRGMVKFRVQGSIRSTESLMRGYTAIDHIRNTLQQTWFPDVVDDEVRQLEWRKLIHHVVYPTKPVQLKYWPALSELILMWIDVLQTCSEMAAIPSTTMNWTEEHSLRFTRAQESLSARLCRRCTKTLKFVPDDLKQEVFDRVCLPTRNIGNFVVAERAIRTITKEFAKNNLGWELPDDLRGLIPDTTLTAYLDDDNYDWLTISIEHALIKAYCYKPVAS